MLVHRADWHVYVPACSVPADSKTIIQAQYRGFAEVRESAGNGGQ